MWQSSSKGAASKVSFSTTNNSLGSIVISVVGLSTYSDEHLVSSPVNHDPTNLSYAQTGHNIVNASQPCRSTTTVFLSCLLFEYWDHDSHFPSGIVSFGLRDTCRHLATSISTVPTHHSVNRYPCPIRHEVHQRSTIMNNRTLKQLPPITSRLVMLIWQLPHFVCCEVRPGNPSEWNREC